VCGFDFGWMLLFGGYCMVFVFVCDSVVYVDIIYVWIIVAGYVGYLVLFDVEWG